MRTFSLDRYLHRAPLRVGCLSQTFGAEQVGELGARPVLLKQLLPALAREPGVAERWLAIAEQNEALHSATCVDVLDVGSVAGAPWFAVANTPGHSLADLLTWAKRTTRWPDVAAVTAIAGGVLEALEEAQRVGLTHLDLSPDAVLVDASGHVVLTEFGLFGALPPASAARLRFDRGKAAYLSPELVRSECPDARSDLFSLGSMLYELLTRERPFQGKTQLLAAMQIASGKRRPLAELAPHVDELVVEIVETLLACDPGARFQSAHAALTALSSLHIPNSRAIARWLAQLESDSPAGGGGGTDAPERVLAAVDSPALAPAPASPAALAPPPALLPAPVDPPAVSPPSTPALPALLAVGPPPDEAVLAPPPLLTPPPLFTAPVHVSPVESTPAWVAPPPLLASAPASPAHAAGAARARDGSTTFLPASGHTAPPSRALAQPALATPAPAFVSGAAPLARAPLPDVTPSQGAGRRWSPGYGEPQGEPALSLADAPLPATQDASRWRDPSKTVFQRRAVAKTATKRGESRVPLAVMVMLALLFSFALAMGGVLLFRLGS